MYIWYQQNHSASKSKLCIVYLYLFSANKNQNQSLQQYAVKIYIKKIIKPQHKSKTVT